ncbi:MAG: hypothetical protein ACI841_001050 [Planctomycetota bacterium]|jgi:hypothetical protein
MLTVGMVLQLTLHAFVIGLSRLSRSSGDLDYHMTAIFNVPANIFGFIFYATVGARAHAKAFESRKFRLGAGEHAKVATGEDDAFRAD